MSNPLKSLHVPRIAAAVARTLEQQKQHKEYKEHRIEEQSSKDVEDMSVELAAIEILPKAEVIIANNQTIVERGYFVTHRHIGHLLPEQFKWTVNGVRIINAVLEKIPVTAPYMAKWASLIAQHLDEAKIEEERNRERKAKYEADNIEVLQEVSEEIVRLFKAQSPMRRNYKQLFNYLLHGMRGFFRGARGVRIIHQAMRKQIQHIDAWELWMQNDLEAAILRDDEFHAARRARFEENKRLHKETQDK